MSERIRVLGGQSVHRTLSRRSVLSSLAAIGAAVILTGCGPDRNRVATNIPVDGELEKKLNIYSWGDYDDPDLVTNWSQNLDVLIQVDSFGSNEELIAKLSASRGTSGYDIVVPTGQFIPQMVDHQLLQPLDHSLLPNLETIDPRFRNMDYDPGNEYSVIKNWGTTGYIYDNTKLKGTYSTWQDFIDLATGPASGTTSLLEDPWEVCQIALGAKGYDLNTEDEEELAECQDIIVNTLAPHIKAYFGNAATAMGLGGFTLMQSWNGDARLGMLDSDNPEKWTFVFPEPSANLFIDNWCIATGAQHPDAAHDFINYIIAPEQALKETDYIGYPTGSSEFTDPSVEGEYELPELIFPSSEVLEKLTSAKLTSAQQTLVEIFTQAQARSGV